MKNSSKIGLLALCIAISITACGHGTKPQTAIDTGKVDTVKKDALTVKHDTTNLDTITKKK